MRPLLVPSPENAEEEEDDSDQEKTEEEVSEAIPDQKAERAESEAGQEGSLDMTDSENGAGYVESSDPEDGQDRHTDGASSSHESRA